MAREDIKRGCLNDQDTFVGNWGSILLGPLGDCENPLNVLPPKGKGGWDVCR